LANTQPIPAPLHSVSSKDKLFKPVSQVKSGQTFRLKDDIGRFLGDLERYKLAITIEGDQGGGKSQFTYQLADAFAGSNFEVGIFSLEMGSDTINVEKPRDRYIKPANQARVHISGEAPEGIKTIREYASKFDVVIIDSWTKLDIDSIEFDTLRKDYPNTIWIVIFQRTGDKQIRGGTRPLYDAGINIEVVKADGTFVNNYAIAAKNRYGQVGIKFNISKNKIVK
jgi:hypothetical protein